MMSERGDAGYAEEVFAEQVTKDKKEIFMARRSAIEGVFFGEVESLIEQPVHISEEKQREYLALEEQFAATLAEGQKALWILTILVLNWIGLLWYYYVYYIKGK